MPPTTPFSRYAVPLMAMTGPAPPEGRLATGLPRLDPYKCQSACTNPASLGVCPPKAAAKAAAFLQLELTAPTPPTGAARPALPLQPQMMSGGMGVSPSTVPVSPCALTLRGVRPSVPAQFAFPMLMFMGRNRGRSAGAASSAQYTLCMQRCKAQEGCGDPPDLGGKDDKKDKKEAEKK